MKIITDNDSQLILKESGLLTRIIGSVLGVAGIGVTIYSVIQPPFVPIGLIGLGVFIIGVLVLLFTKSDVVTVDRANRSLSVTFSSLINRAGKTQTCSFDDVVAVTMTKSYETTNTSRTGNNTGGISFGTNGINAGNTQTSIRMNLALQLRDGTTLTIANEQQATSLGTGISHSSLVEIGQKLAETLSVPYQESGMSNDPVEIVKTVMGHLQGTPNPESSTPPVAPPHPVQPSTVTIPGASAPQPETPTNPPVPPQV